MGRRVRLGLSAAAAATVAVAGLWAPAEAAAPAGAGAPAAVAVAAAGASAGAGREPVSRDADAGRAIERAAAAARAVPGDQPVEQVARAVALFRRNHPGYVSPATRNGVAPVAAVAAEAARTAVGTRAAGTQCAPTWTAIEVGSSGRYAVPRLWTTDGYVRYLLTGNGPASEPWNNWLLLCRDALWAAGDHAFWSNLAGRYLYVEDSGYLALTATAITDVRNLLRVQNYDGNFQALWSPWRGRWVVHLYPDRPAFDLLEASSSWLDGNTLFRVRPKPASLARLP
jgi:hypothetical protein